MGRNKGGRPEWFKFWRRNRAQLDIEELSMESRGRVFTNMMRYFDQDELLEMTPIETLAFNVLKVNVDDSISEYEETSRKNRENVNKRWHSDEYDRIRPYTMDTKIEDRRQKTEGRRQKESKADKPPLSPVKRYGAYGWVQLSDEQHSRLLSDLGQQELDRCIQYVDESAQLTGNKNHWKDWNLTIRKCHRDGWGQKQSINQQTANEDWMKGRVVGWNGNE